MPVTEAQVIEALRPVQDPELHVSIVDLDMVRGVHIEGGRVAVTVALTVAGCPLRTEITRRVTDAVAPLDGVDDVAVDLTVMTDEERHALREKLSGGQAQGHAHAAGQGRPIPFAEGSRTRVLGISSGKGGVGKSPGTGDVALSMAQFLPRSEVFVVTTPQAAAQRVAQRSALMAEKVRLDVVGVIENMSWFTGDDGKRYDLFGTGGGAALAESLGVP